VREAQRSSRGGGSAEMRVKAARKERVRGAYAFSDLPITIGAAASGAYARAQTRDVVSAGARRAQAVPVRRCGARRHMRSSVVRVREEEECEAGCAEARRCSAQQTDLESITAAQRRNARQREHSTT